MEETFGRGHGHKGCYLTATAALAKDGHIGRVSSEHRNIVADPFQGLHDVQHAHISAIGIAGAIGAQVQEPQGVEPVVQGHHHHSVVAGQISAVVAGLLLGRALGEAAAVQPYHHGHPGIGLDARRPHVHAEAVLAGVSVVPVHGEGLGVVPPAAARGVRGHGAVGAAGTELRPGLGVHGRHEALRLPVRDTFIYIYAVVHIAADGAALDGHGRSFGRCLQRGDTFLRTARYGRAAREGKEEDRHDS